MASPELPIIAKAAQDLNIWLRDLCKQLEWEDKARALRLLRSVLHVVRDRVSIDEAAQFSAQLPVLIRGLYYEQWNPKKLPTKMKTKEDFIAAVEAAFEKDPNDNPEQVTRAALEVLSWHISAGEISDLKSCMPDDIKQLWP